MNLNYILVATPDKVSLNAFLKFLRKALGRDYVIGEMHSLMSPEAKDLYLHDFMTKFPKGLLSYYAKGVLKAPADPIICVPTKALEVSQAAVWFDLYSTIPRVLKDSENFFPPILENWKKYIESLSV